MCKLVYRIAPLAAALAACAAPVDDGGDAVESNTTVSTETAEVMDVSRRAPLRDDRPADVIRRDPPRQERTSAGKRPGKGHADLCNKLRLISSANSDAAAEAYERGDKKAGREHASVADRAWQDAKDWGCGWAG